MSIPRFHIEPQAIAEGTAFLNRQETKHALSVLRLKIGDVVELFDGHGLEYRGFITGEKNGQLAIAVQGPSAKDPVTRCRLTLAMSVIKPDRMETMIQKTCELGVHAIIPLLTDRSVVRLSKDRWQSKVERWRKIALESCKQCGRSRAPEIGPVRLFKEWINHPGSYERILIPTLAAPGLSLHAALECGTAADILCLIGPEGDFTKEEVNRARAHGAQAVRLGTLILRSETAAIYMASAIQFYCQGVMDAKN